MGWFDKEEPNKLKQDEFLRAIFIGWCLAQESEKYNNVILKLLFDSKFCCKECFYNG